MDDFSDGASDVLSNNGNFSPLKLKRALVLVGAGLIMVGVMFLKKSRYAEGGVMGVLRSSFFCFIMPGEAASGLRSSEGNPPDPGV